MEKLICRMITFEKGDPARIQHFLKVHSLARLIGIMEGVNAYTQYVLETAAIVHDIGIPVCEKKYGRCDGKLQEQEGGTPAREMLEELGYSESVIDRVVYLVEHHHTYTDIRGLDYQILVEADFLVNLYEEKAAEKEIRSAGTRIFRTETGKGLLREMFGVDC